MSVGIDIIENERFLNADEKLVDKILSEQEKLKYNKFTSVSRKAEYLASRFSAKEALFKAGLRNKSYINISILNDKDGSPHVYLLDKKLNYDISISHSKLCSVVIVTNNDTNELI